MVRHRRLCRDAGGHPAGFVWNGNRILSEGWEYAAPTPAIIVSAIAWVLVIEGTRRAGGIVLAIIIALMSLYPMKRKSCRDRFPAEPRPWATRSPIIC